MRIYWASPDAKRGGLLLALAVGLELGTVYGNVLLAYSQQQIFDTVQNRDMATFFASLGIFTGLLVAFLFVNLYRFGGHPQPHESAIGESHVEAEETEFYP